MKKAYSEMFEKLAPQKSDKELFGAVLNSRRGNITMDNNKKNTKKHGIKMIVAPLAAAIVVAGTTVGAMAVYNRNLSQEYNEVLARNAEGGFAKDRTDVDGNKVNQGNVALDNGLYEQLNITLDKTFEYEDFTLKFPGAICDGTDILVMYNITFNKHLECLDIDGQGFSVWGANGDLDLGLYDGTRARSGIFSTRDGKTVYSSFVDYTGVENCGEQLDLHFEEIRSYAGYVGMQEYRVDLDIDLEIPLTGDLTRFNKTFKAADAPHIDIGGWGEWDVDSIEITPLSVKVNTKTDGEVPERGIFKKYWPVFPVNVMFKDGSTLELGDTALSQFWFEPEDKTCAFKANFNYPIIVDDVQSVQFSSAVVNEDGSTETVDVPEPVERYQTAGGSQK